MLRIPLKDPSVSSLCGIVLGKLSAIVNVISLEGTNIFLLLVNVTDLKPDIFLREGPWRVCNDIFEALMKSASISDRPMQEITHLQALTELLLLLVYDAKPEVDLICLLEVRLHAHHLGKCFLRMLERAISIV